MRIHYKKKKIGRADTYCFAAEFRLLAILLYFLATPPSIDVPFCLSIVSSVPVETPKARARHPPAGCFSPDVLLTPREPFMCT